MTLVLTFFGDVKLRQSDLGDAIFSPDETYRYVLRRQLRPSLFGGDSPGKRLVFVMLNPSIATEFVDDPTIRRCMGYAESWGYTHLYVVNLFAYRATDPAELRRHDSPIGPLNDQCIKAVAERCEGVVMAWGNLGEYLNRAAEVEDILHCVSDPHFLMMTKKGQPQHPLYLPKGLTPRRATPTG